MFLFLGSKHLSSSALYQGNMWKLASLSAMWHEFPVVISGLVLCKASATFSLFC